MAEKKLIPAIKGWFEGDAESFHLIGSKCKSCSEVFFPKIRTCGSSYCESTSTEDMTDVPLSRTGVLWSYSVNYYPPPVSYIDPKSFKPYGVAAVELADEKIKICGRISSSADLDTIRIGMKMELITEPLYKNEEGQDVVTWAWKPVGK